MNVKGKISVGLYECISQKTCEDICDFVRWLQMALFWERDVSKTLEITGKVGSLTDPLTVTAAPHIGNIF